MRGALGLQKRRQSSQVQVCAETELTSARAREPRLEVPHLSITANSMKEVNPAPCPRKLWPEMNSKLWRLKAQTFQVSFSFLYRAWHQIHAIETTKWIKSSRKVTPNSSVEITGRAGHLSWQSDPMGNPRDLPRDRTGASGTLPGSASVQAASCTRGSAAAPGYQPAVLPQQQRGISRRAS